MWLSWRLTTLVVALGMLGTTLMPPTLRAQEAASWQVATADGQGTELLVEPGDGATATTVLPEGTAVWSIGADVTIDVVLWRNVRDASGRTGYVQASQLGALASASSPVVSAGSSVGAGQTTSPQSVGFVPGARPDTEHATARDTGPPVTAAPPAAAPRPDAQPTATATGASVGMKDITVRRGGRTYHSTTFETEAGPDGQPMRAGSLIVQLRPGAPASARDAMQHSLGAVSVDRLAIPDTVRVQVQPGNADQAIATLRARQDVLRVEPDSVYNVAFTPNDPQLGAQYGLAKISAPAAWDVTHSSPSIRIAILDCGIYSRSSAFPSPDGKPGHPDIRDKVVLEQDFSGSPHGVDDFCGVGTGVAGIAAATTNNGIGIAGVGFDATVMNGKVLDDNAQGSAAQIVNGIMWATDNGAKVIHMSFTGPAACPAAIQTAVDYAWAHGVVLVGAAGNTAATGPLSPASCNHVVSVTATDQNDTRQAGANSGGSIQLAAPGVGIATLDEEGGYVTASGTAAASSHVAGLAALVWTSSNGTSNQAVVAQICNAADPVTGTGTQWSCGRINAARAVAPAPTLPAPGPCPTPRPAVRVSVTRNGQGSASATITAGAGIVRKLRFGASTGALIDISGSQGATGPFDFVPTTALQQVTFTIRASSTTSAATAPVTVTDDCGDWQTLVGSGPAGLYAGTVSGTVTSSSNFQGIVGATVRVLGTSLATTTGTGGTFSIANVPIGAQTIEISAAGRTTKTQSVTVTVGGTAFASITLTSTTGTVTGSVRRTSFGAIPNATVAIVGTQLSTTTDATGAFTLANVPVGSQQLQTSATGFVTDTRTVTVDPDFSIPQSITLSATTATVTGQVRSSTSFAPISGATVTVLSTGQSGVTDGTGQFSIPNVPVGSQQIRASAAGFQPSTQTTTVSDTFGPGLFFVLSP